jgi:adenylate cyclase
MNPGRERGGRRSWRLLGEDEEGMHAMALRREMSGPKIANHRGRIPKATGDGLLAELPSVVDAVRCAVALQRATASRNDGIANVTQISGRMTVVRCNHPHL